MDGRAVAAVVPQSISGRAAGFSKPLKLPLVSNEL